MLSLTCAHTTILIVQVGRVCVCLRVSMQKVTFELDVFDVI